MLVEVDSRNCDFMLNHLTRYQLRNQISIEKTNFQVYQSFEKTRHEIQFKDPRHLDMGYRVLSMEKSSELGTEYTRKRMILGIPEGIHCFPVGHALPLECNLDLMNGGIFSKCSFVIVDFRKGCYLGQELTIRTFHTGVIRKRIVPLEINCQDKLLQGTAITNAAGTKVGIFCENEGNVGLGLVRLDVFSSNNALQLENGCSIQAKKPQWWNKVT